MYLSVKVKEHVMILFLLIIFLVLIFFKFPLYLSILTPSMLYLIVHPEISILTALQKMMSSVDSFPLLAVPLFLMAGLIMNRGGITDRIFDFANVLVGHFKGGLGHVNVIASLIFSGMSGAATADAGGLGLVELKAMKKQGYDDGFSIGVTAASSIIGPIFPPSIPAVIFGALANVSVGGLFIGGIIPAFLMVISLCVLISIISHKRSYPVHKRASLKTIFLGFKRAFFPLLAPGIIVGGIWFGFVTPTEAAVLAIVYSLIVTVVIFKELNVSELPGIMLEVARMLAPALAILMPAVLFGWILVYENVDQLLLEQLLNISSNRYVLLIIINVFLLIAGMFVDPVPIMMILIPILKPVMQTLNIHPIQFGVMMILNLMIGLLTPPIGSVLFILSSVTNVPIEKIMPDLIKFLIPLIIVLLLVTFIPQIVLFLPRLAGLVY
jgi:tripartite ATP-independent transporter DctM subunit